jgi:hypothetical protein
MRHREYVFFDGDDRHDKLLHGSLPVMSWEVYMGVPRY